MATAVTMVVMLYNLHTIKLGFNLGFHMINIKAAQTCLFSAFTVSKTGVTALFG
jgi:hypothetical protein